MDMFLMAYLLMGGLAVAAAAGLAFEKFLLLRKRRQKHIH